MAGGQLTSANVLAIGRVSGNPGGTLADTILAGNGSVTGNFVVRQYQVPGGVLFNSSYPTEKQIPGDVFINDIAPTVTGSGLTITLQNTGFSAAGTVSAVARTATLTQTLQDQRSDVALSRGGVLLTASAAALALDGVTLVGVNFRSDIYLSATGIVGNNIVGGQLQDLFGDYLGAVTVTGTYSVAAAATTITASGHVVPILTGTLNSTLDDAGCNAFGFNPNAAQIEVSDVASARKAPRIIRKFLAYRMPLIAQSEEDATKIIRSVKKKAKATVAKIAQTKAAPELEIPQIIVRGQPDYMARIQAEVDKANAEIRAALQRAEQERDDEEVMMLLLH